MAIKKSNPPPPLHPPMAAHHFQLTLPQISRLRHTGLEAIHCCRSRRMARLPPLRLKTTCPCRATPAIPNLRPQTNRTSTSPPMPSSTMALYAPHSHLANLPFYPPTPRFPPVTTNNHFPHWSFPSQTPTPHPQSPSPRQHHHLSALPALHPRKRHPFPLSPESPHLSQTLY